MRLSVEKIARVCHELNRAYCEAIGDHSQTVWEDAPDWQKTSALDGVMAIVNGDVRSPRDSHDAWCREKKLAGWKYGPVKDPESRTHPMLVPFNELPQEQQAKDTLFYHTAVTLLSIE